MCSFLVWKNACLNYREFDLEGDLVGTPCMIFIGLVFHYTIKAYLKRVWHCGYACVEKDMRWFTKNMSKQTHCTSLQDICAKGHIIG